MWMLSCGWIKHSMSPKIVNGFIPGPCKQEGKHIARIWVDSVMNCCCFHNRKSVACLLQSVLKLRYSWWGGYHIGDLALGSLWLEGWTVSSCSEQALRKGVSLRSMHLYAGFCLHQGFITACVVSTERLNKSWRALLILISSVGSWAYIYPDFSSVYGELQRENSSLTVSEFGGVCWEAKGVIS